MWGMLLRDILVPQVSAVLKTIPRFLQYLGPRHFANSQELSVMIGNEREKK